MRRRKKINREKNRNRTNGGIGGNVLIDEFLRSKSIIKKDTNNRNGAGVSVCVCEKKKKKFNNGRFNPLIYIKKLIFFFLIFFA